MSRFASALVWCSAQPTRGFSPSICRSAARTPSRVLPKHLSRRGGSSGVMLRVETTVTGARAESVCDCSGFEPFGAVSPIAGEPDVVAL